MIPPPAATEKEKLRTRMRGLLRMATEAERASRSQRILNCLLASEKWVLSGQAVAFFGGLKNEPNLHPLLPWLVARSIPAALFAIEGEDLVPYRVSSEADIESGAMGVWEPNRNRCMKMRIEELGTVLVPALAFGKDGTRLGRGKGYYDRLLNHPMCHARRIGVGFAQQVLDSVPSEPHDAKLHALVTDAGWSDVATGRSLEVADHCTTTDFAAGIRNFLADIFISDIIADILLDP